MDKCNLKIRSDSFRICGMFLATLGLVTLAWASDDPWKSKPFQKWDEKDVQRIMNDSPWAKIVQVPAPWKTARAEVGDVDDSGGMKQGAHDPAGPGAPAAGITDQGPQAAQAKFIIRWVSSRTILEAAYRRAVLAGQMTQEDADKQLAKPVESYQVFVSGPDMSPFQSADENTLKDAAFLMNKKTKQKIAPVRVQIQRSSDSKTIQAIVFHFPKKSATGEASIAADEKGVEFTCVFAKTRIQTSFDLSKMEDSQGRDL